MNRRASRRAFAIALWLCFCALPAFAQTEPASAESPAEHGEAVPVGAAPAVEHGAATSHEAAGHGEGGHGGHHVTPGDWIKFAVSVVNFALLLFLLVKFGRAPITSYLTRKRETYLEAVEQARRAKEAADRLHREYTEKLAHITEEGDAILARAQQEAERRKEAILDAARRAAERMANDARMTIDNEVLRAQTEIRAALAELVVEKAEKVIRERIGPQDHRRLTEEFLRKLEKAS